MAKTNLNILSKAQLIALVEANEAKPSAAPTASASAAPSDNLTNELLATLLVKQLSTDSDKTTDADDTRLSLDLVNISGTALGVEVRDPFNGSMKFLSFERQGQVHRISPRQLRELKAEVPAFFENGLVTVKGEVSDNPNVIADIPAFIEEIDLNDVNSRIAEITSSETLFRLFGEIESRRYKTAATSTDANGKQQLSLEPQQISPKEMVMLTAVQARIATVSPVLVRLDS